MLDKKSYPGGSGCWERWPECWQCDAAVQPGRVRLAWMVKAGPDAGGPLAWPLATVSVCVGGFCGSALAAFWKKEQGLLTGLLLGGLFAAALSGLLLTLYRQPV